MSDAVIVALITATASVLCQLMISKKGKKDRLVSEALREQKVNDRLEAIEHKLDIHNGYAEKLGSIATSLAVLENEIKNIKEK